MESFARKRTSIAWIVLAVTVLVASWAVVSSAGQEKAATPKPQNKTALGESDVKQLLLLMDTDKNGEISRKEYTDFMAAEFDRLDTDKSGELDPRNWQSRVFV